MNLTDTACRQFILDTQYGYPLRLPRNHYDINYATVERLNGENILFLSDKRLSSRDSTSEVAKSTLTTLLSELNISEEFLSKSLAAHKISDNGQALFLSSSDKIKEYELSDIEVLTEKAYRLGSKHYIEILRAGVADGTGYIHKYISLLSHSRNHEVGVLFSFLTKYRFTNITPKKKLYFSSFGENWSVTVHPDILTFSYEEGDYVFYIVEKNEKLTIHTQHLEKKPGHFIACPINNKNSWQSQVIYSCFEQFCIHSSVKLPSNEETSLCVSIYGIHKAPISSFLAISKRLLFSLTPPSLSTYDGLFEELTADSSTLCEILTQSMISLKGVFDKNQHKHQLRREFIRMLSVYTPKGTHCTSHEVELFIAIGRVLAFGLHDKQFYSSAMLPNIPMKALFAFTAEDFKLDSSLTYERVFKNVIDCERNRDFQITNLITNASRSFNALTEKRIHNIAENIFLLDCSYLYCFYQNLMSKDILMPMHHVTEGALLGKEELLEHEEFIKGLKCFQSNEILSESDIRIISMAMRRMKSKTKMTQTLKMLKSIIIRMIKCIYEELVEPCYLIAWSFYLHSVMQYNSMSKEEQSESPIDVYLSGMESSKKSFVKISLHNLDEHFNRMDYLTDIPNYLLPTSAWNIITNKLMRKTRVIVDVSNCIAAAEDSSEVIKQKTKWMLEYCDVATSFRKNAFFNLISFTRMTHSDELKIAVKADPQMESRLLRAEFCNNTIFLSNYYYLYNNTTHSYDKIDKLTKDNERKIKSEFLEMLIFVIEEYQLSQCVLINGHTYGTTILSDTNALKESKKDS